MRARAVRRARAGKPISNDERPARGANVQAASFFLMARDRDSV